MTASLKAIDGSADLGALMGDLARAARAAARTLALASPEQKNRALDAMARAIRADSAAILAANAEDVAEARASGANAAFIDRLDAEREARRSDGRRPRGHPRHRRSGRRRHRALDAAERPDIERVRTPLGVIGVIFESRPNVTADAGALCLKAGNAVILRGGSESFRSCRAIHAACRGACAKPACPRLRSRWCRPRDRAAVGRDARRPRRQHRRHRAARRQDPGRPRAGRGARAGVRASRGPLPHLCRRRRRPRRWPKSIVTSTPRCGAPASAAPPRRCWSTRSRRHAS